MSKKKRLIIEIIAFVIIAGGIGAAFTTGRLYAGIKQPNEKIIKQEVICGQDTINKFNDVITSAGSKDTDTKLSDIRSEIMKKSNYKNDPSCVYIKLYTEITNPNTANDAKATYKELENLVAKGLYINSNLSGITSLPSLKNIMDPKKPESSRQGYGRG